MSTARYSKRYGYNDNYAFKSSGTSSLITFDGFIRGCARVAREAERQARNSERERQRVARADERHVAETVRAVRRAEINAKARAREHLRQHQANQVAEAERLTSGIVERLEELDGTLAHTLAIDDTISFDELRRTPAFPKFEIPENLATNPIRPSLDHYILGVARPWSIFMHFGFVRRRYEEKLKSAKEEYKKEMNEYEVTLDDIQKKIASLERKYSDEKQAFLKAATEFAAKVDQFEHQYRSGSTDGIQTYCSMVLERSEYPEGLEQEFQIEYQDVARKVVVRYDFPEPSVVPEVQSFNYVKSRDSIDQKRRSQAEITKIYRKLVASIALRTVHELLEADQGSFIDSVELVGSAQLLSAATGKLVKETVVRLAITKTDFNLIDFKFVDPIDCVTAHGGALRYPRKT